MRIIIEIEDDKVAARIDQPTDQLRDTHPASAANAGSAPVELLRDFAIHGTATVDPTATGKKRPNSKPGEDLNPLRTGEAIAREHLAYSTRQLGDSVETIYAGGPPSLPNAAEEKPTAKRKPKGK